MIHLYLSDETPFQKIYEVVIDGKKPKDPAVTKTLVQPELNFAFLLDKACNDLNTAITETQNTHMEGDFVPLPGCSKKLKLFKFFAPLELKFLKKEFVNLTKLHPPSNLKAIPDLYLAFINSSEAKDD